MGVAAAVVSSLEGIFKAALYEYAAENVVAERVFGGTSKRQLPGARRRPSRFLAGRTLRMATASV